MRLHVVPEQNTTITLNCILNFRRRFKRCYLAWRNNKSDCLSLSASIDWSLNVSINYFFHAEKSLNASVFPNCPQLANLCLYPKFLQEFKLPTDYFLSARQIITLYIISKKAKLCRNCSLEYVFFAFHSFCKF